MKFSDIPESTEDVKIKIDYCDGGLKFNLENLYIRPEWKAKDILDKLRVPITVSDPDGKNGKQELAHPFDVVSKVILDFGPLGCKEYTKDEYSQMTSSTAYESSLDRVKRKIQEKKDERKKKN